ncbi:ROK family transcriptional regulator [Nitrospirillum viridazoti]|uniref:Sugar kinase n=1 Tax=Nitrospirillum viridazoti CBAmc TaxID=1441467 RepID=A0A248K2S4_9PROT|nr:ROK family transcriptional regulator [Nitrospirillum amazonense]ASG25273.1 sugar kinase [Nitrospirillum amazonense CBAmc]TWB35353.1 putative NBD/HSP70 family sugar kinase [Nitrospirillum amazonense]
MLDGHGHVDALHAIAASLSGTNLERASDHNQRVTLQAIRVSGQITRAELVELTGLTLPAIANITKRLLAEGLIVEAGRQHGGRGQPAILLEMNPDGCFSIGVTIDRDHITLVVLDLLGTVRARASREIDLAPPEVVAQFFRTEISAILTATRLPLSRFIGIGVAMPDDIGRVSLARWPQAYAAWRDVDVARLFADVLPLPVFVENDATAAALGELQFGHGLRHRSFFYILISGGLGGGIVVDGSQFRGARGRSGEIGFLPVRSDRTTARTLQEAVSLSALYDRLAAAGYTVDEPEQLCRLAGTPAEAVVEEWIELAADLMTDPLVATNCLVNPEAIFLGGRLPAPLVDKLAAALNHRLGELRDIPQVAPVLRAAMAADAPAVGAGMLPFTDRLLPSRAALMKTADN